VFRKCRSHPTLYEADHSREWLIAAGRALSFLAKSRAGRSKVPADHWALIATARLLPYCDQNSCPASSREELIRHVVQICNSIVREQFRGSAALGLDGAFDPTGNTSSVATYLEGLLAVLEFMPKDEPWTDELRKKIMAVVERGIAFLLRMQIRSGPYSGGVPGAFATRVLNSSEVRIDYVQHALCAWLRYQNQLQNVSESSGAPCRSAKSMRSRPPLVVSERLRLQRVVRDLGQSMSLYDVQRTLVHGTVMREDVFLESRPIGVCQREH
jgi:hypothetical protein